MSIIVCGEFYQLPSVRGLPVYSIKTSIKILPILDLLRKCKKAESIVGQREGIEMTVFQ